MTSVKVDWQYWTKQRQAIKKATQKDPDIVVFQGGYRSGKSIAGSRWIVRTALKQKGHYLAMAVDYSRGKNTTYNVFFSQLPGENTDPFSGGNPTNSPVVTHWTKMDKNLTLANGSVITLAGADTPERYEGGSFNAVWMDEPGNYKNRLGGVVSTIIERLDHGWPETIMFTTTGKTGSLQTFLQKREWPQNHDKVNLNIEIIKASTLNNPFLTKDQKERLKRRYEGSVNEDMALHGGFGQAEGRVYRKFSRERHVRTREELLKKVDEGEKRVFGYDAGWNDEMVVLHAAKSPTGELLILDEFYESEKYVEDAITWIKTFEKGTIFCEHEPSHIEKFQKETKHKSEKAVKSLDAGIRELRKRFEKDGVFISETCENLIKELLEYEESDVGGTNVSDHACDALRYLVMGVETSGSGKIETVSNPFSVG